MRPSPLLAIALAAIVVAGCAANSGPGSHAGDQYVVNAQRTSFYEFGPAQANGADFSLYHGQRVTMLTRDYGYSHVALVETGQNGYVATDDLIPAPPAPKPSPSPTPSRHRRQAEQEAYPPGAQPTVPLPEFPESRPPPNAPRFRY